MVLVEELTREWRSRLQTECPDQPEAHETIICWLIGEHPERLAALEVPQLSVVQQAMDYRYRILRQRYLGIPPEQAYRALIQRLSSLFLIRSKIRTWVSLSRDRRRSVMDVLQEVIQELIQNDSYIRQQVVWIGHCTRNSRLRNALMLATVEEYCLRPIRNQPLLAYRFVNYLRRSQRGGMTQVPTGDLVRLVSEEIMTEDADNPVSLLDNQAVSQYQEEQAFEEQQMLRTSVQKEFMAYLEEEVSPMAAQWLELHLQGKSQEAIAQELNLPIKQVYRLREKISYHAMKVFALKHAASDMVSTWLGTSLRENSLGLAPDQWQIFWRALSTSQQQIVEQLKAGQTMETIARDLGMRPNQAMTEWIKACTIAQELRNE